jgi:hypothetical protein
MLASGLWPLVSIKSFEAITGPKVDTWLVKTVGCLLTVVGARTLLSARTHDEARKSGTVAGGVSATLAYISGYYATRGRISKVYLLDSAIQTTWTLLWVRALMARERDDSPGESSGG